MVLYLPKRTINQVDAAAAATATEPLIDDLRVQYRQALSPDPMEQTEPEQPSWQLPSLDSLGVGSTPTAVAPPSITSVIGAVPGMVRQAQQTANDVISWALPSLESLGVTPKRPEQSASAYDGGGDGALPTRGSSLSEGDAGAPVAPQAVEQRGSVAPASSSGYAPSSGKGAEGVERWSSIVAEAARAYNLPEATIKGLMEIESGGRADAVSAAGAQGLMQVMPFHFKPGEDPKDPRTNIFRGAKVYADALARYGDPDKAAAAYFGAIDNAGNITGATDATGTDGHKYVALWRAAASKYGGGSPNAGAAAPQAAPAASPQPPTTGSGPPSPSAGGSGGGQITVRHKRTGLESRVTPDQYAQMTNRDEFEVVSGGSAGQDMQRVSLGSNAQFDEPSGDPFANEAPGSGIPGLGQSERDNRDLSTGRQLGDERPTRLEGRLERPVIRPPEYVPPQGAGSMPPAASPIPVSPVTSWPAMTDDVMYRQPLGPTMGPDTTTGEPFDPDSGPRESGYTLPPAYNDPTTTGTQTQPIVAPPSTYGAAGDEPPAAPYQPTYGPAPVAETEPESPLKPLYDLGGRIVGYVQAAPDAAYNALAPAREAAAALDQGKGYGQVTSTPGEPDYVETRQNPITRALTTSITAPERPGPLVGPYRREDFPTEEGFRRFQAGQGAADDVADIPYQAAEAGRQSIEEAARSFADMIRAGEEGRTLAAAGNALWGAIQVAGLPWTVAARTINQMLPEANIAGIGAGDAATSIDLVRLGIQGVNGLKNAPRLLSPENLARADDAIRGPVEAAGRAGRGLAEEGARQLMNLTPQPRIVPESGGTIGRGGAPMETPKPGARLPAGYVYHNTTQQALDAIEREGFSAGSFSDRPIDFGGDVWIAVRKDALPDVQTQTYGRATAYEPNFVTGYDAQGFPIEQAIPPDAIVVTDRRGRVIRTLGQQDAGSTAVEPPGFLTRARSALDANAERVAQADARMAAEGSTAAPGALGQIPEQFGQPYPPIRGDVRGVVREQLGEPSSEMLADSRFPREAVHPDIRDAGIGPRITPQIDLSERANAGFGVVPGGDKSGRRWIPDARYSSGGYWWTPSRIANPDEVRAGILQRADLREAERRVQDANGAYTTARIERAEVERQLSRAPDDPELQQNLMGAIRREEEAQGTLDAAREWHQMVRTGDRTLTTAGIAPDAATSDPLAAVNRVLGQGVASAVSGGVGAQVNQAMNPDDPNAAIKGFAVGALGPVAAARGARAVARRVGAEAGSGSGLLAMFGQAPGAGGFNPNQVQRAVRNAQQQATPGLSPLEWTRKFFGEVGYSSMIGPATFTVNLTGNVLEPLWSIPKEAARAVARGNPREFGEMSKGVFQGGVFNGLREVGSAMVDALAARGRYAPTPGHAPLSAQTNNPIGRAITTGLEAGGRVFSALPDAIFGTIAQGAGEARAAAQIATDAGLKGTAWKQHVNDLLNDAASVKAGQLPTLSDTQRVLDEGAEYAKRQTFQSELGTIGKNVRDFATIAVVPDGKGGRDALPVVGNLVTPFFNTPWSMSLRMGERTPLGLAMNSQGSRFDKYYDATVGSALLAGIAAGPVAAGLITGSGPQDPQKKSEMRATGWRPYSTLIDGVYVPNRVFGIYAPLLNAAADVHDAIVYAKDKSPGSVTSDYVGRLGQQLQQQPYLQGISSIMQAIQAGQGGGLGSAAERYASSTITRMVPYAATSRTIGTALDPNERTVDQGKNVPAETTIRQQVQSGVGLRSGLPVAQDVLGRPQENQQQGVKSLFARTSSERPDSTVQAFLDAGVDIGFPKTKLTVDTIPIDLTPDETRRWNTYRGEILQRFSGNLTSRSFWSNPEARKVAMEDLLRQANAAADDRLMQSIGGADIRRRVLESRQQQREQLMQGAR